MRTKPFFLIVTILCAMLFFACSNEGEMEVVKLRAPEPTIVYRSTSFDVTWVAVPNADGYIYSIDGGEEQTTSQCQILVSGLDFKSQHTLKLRAVDSSLTYAASDWATFNITTSDARTFDAVELSVNNLSLHGFTLSWVAVRNATNYEYKIDEGEVLSTDKVFVNFEDVTAGEHTVAVRPANSNPDFVEAEWSSITVSTNKELDTKGTANCYIATAPGYHSFKATTIGNGSFGVRSQECFHTQDPSINPVAVKLLWQDYYEDGRGLISDLLLEDGKVYFEVAEPFVAGNAVVAVTDDNDNILWSWHLWFSDVDFTNLDNVDHYTCNLYSAGFDVMDRNLGATSANENDYSSIGLHYQWGRKDPFVTVNTNDVVAEYNNGGPFAMSTTTYDIEGNVIAPVSITRGGVDFEKDTWAAVKTSETAGTVAMTIAYPMNFIASSDSWFYGGGEGALWGNPYAYGEEVNSNHGRKSIYDPCPVGWRVAPQETFTYMQTSDGQPNTYTISKYGGWFFNSKSSIVWFPANGSRDRSTACVASGHVGNIWTSSFYSTEKQQPSSFSFSYHDSEMAAYGKTASPAANGYGVRCVRE